MHELQKLMGHSSITTTADFYLDVGDDVAAKVGTAFAVTNPQHQFEQAS